MLVGSFLGGSIHDGAPGLREAAAQQALPDSALDAVKGRQVTLTLASGLEASGELVGFDAKTISIVNAKGKVIVVQRADVTDLAISGAEPAPAPGPAQPAALPEPLPSADPAGEPPPPTQPKTPPAPPPAPRAAAPPVNASPYGPYRPPQQGNDESDRKAASGKRLVIAGSVLGGAGLILGIIGIALYTNAPRELECDEVACSATSPTDSVAPAGLMMFLGGASLVTSAILLPVGGTRLASSGDQVSVVPTVRVGATSAMATWRF